MTYDSEKHTTDQHGFLVDKDTGHRVGLESVPHARVSNDNEYPKWVKPHEHHIVRKNSGAGDEHVSTPAFPDFFIDRATGAVTVLVKDAEEEAKAASDPQVKHEEVEKPT